MSGWGRRARGEILDPMKQTSGSERFPDGYHSSEHNAVSEPVGLSSSATSIETQQPLSWGRRETYTEHKHTDIVTLEILQDRKPDQRSIIPDKALEQRLFGNTEEKQMTQGINFDAYDKIPVSTEGNDVPGPIEFFNESISNERLLANIALARYKTPTPIQKYSLPVLIAGRDLMSCAQTGSGKTAAFLLPIGQALAGKPVSTTVGRRCFPRSLVLAPTRELAIQIWKESRKVTYCTGMNAVAIYGGQESSRQVQKMQRGADIMVATPGRLEDFVNRGRIDLSKVEFFVLDEADRMLDMGFEPSIRAIAERIPVSRQTMMFSATFPDAIKELASDYCKDYVFLSAGRIGSTAAHIVQKVIECPQYGYKLNQIRNTINDTIPNGLILVFTETKRSAEKIKDMLQGDGFLAVSIHGDKTQHERESALRSFRNGTNPILVATDVASRGLDISNIMTVINFDLPKSLDDYVHR